MTPENPSTALVITSQSPALARVSNQLTLTNKLLAKPEEPFLIPYRKGDKWGFCDRNKTIVIDCIYNYVHDFREGFAVVIRGGVYEIINKKGDLVIIPNCDHMSGFIKGLANVYRDGKYGFIDIDNNAIIPVIYEYIGVFCGDLFIARLNRKYGIINRYNEIIIPFIFENILEIKNDDMFIYSKNEGKEHFVASIVQDKTISSHCGAYFISDHLISVAITSNKDTWKIINIEGKYINKDIYQEVNSFHDGLACVKMNGKKGFIDFDCLEKIPLIYRNTADKFCANNTLVLLNDYWQMINNKGEYISDTKYGNNYDMIFAYSDGFSCVNFENNKNSFMMPNGKYVFFEENFNVIDFENGIGFIQTNEGLLLGYINTEGIAYWEN